MNCFDVTEVLTTQGADKDAMAAVLESLHKGNLAPAWGQNEIGANLSFREVVSILLGSTSARPEDAAQHCVTVAGLIRSDGSSFGEILTKIMSSDPHDIKVKEITVSTDGRSAAVKYSGGTYEVFYAGGELKPFYHACIIRGSVLQMIALKMKHPTESGWTEKP